MEDSTTPAAAVIEEPVVEGEDTVTVTVTNPEESMEGIEQKSTANGDVAAAAAATTSEVKVDVNAIAAEGSTTEQVTTDTAETEEKPSSSSSGKDGENDTTEAAAATSGAEEGEGEAEEKSDDENASIVSIDNTKTIEVIDDVLFTLSSALDKLKKYRVELTGEITSIEVGTKVLKLFESKDYNGEVISLPTEKEPYYRVQYEDGDQEEMSEKEVKKHAAKYYENVRKKEESRRRRRSQRRRKIYREEAVDGDDKTDEDEEGWTPQDEPSDGKKKRGRPRKVKSDDDLTPKKKRGRPKKSPEDGESTPNPNSEQKRKRGRPRKTPVPDSDAPKKKRGRPRKTPVKEDGDEEMKEVEQTGAANVNASTEENGTTENKDAMNGGVSEKVVEESKETNLEVQVNVTGDVNVVVDGAEFTNALDNLVEA